MKFKYLPINIKWNHTQFLTDKCELYAGLLPKVVSFTVVQGKLPCVYPQLLVFLPQLEQG